MTGTPLSRNLKFRSAETDYLIEYHSRIAGDHHPERPPPLHGKVLNDKDKGSNEYVK
jgi:hypothetical protein